MAGPIPPAANISSTPLQAQAQKTENLSSKWANHGRQLVGLLLETIGLDRSTNTATTAAKTPPAPQEAAGGENQPPKFDAEKWLTKECELLTNALKEKTPEGPRQLHAIYSAAQTLKKSLENNYDNIRDGLSEPLRSDFEANANLIQKHFTNNETTSSVTSDELKFLLAYVGFLKICVSKNTTLDKSLDELSTALHKALKANVRETETTAGSANEPAVATTGAQNSALSPHVPATPPAGSTPPAPAAPPAGSTPPAPAAHPQANGGPAPATPLPQTPTDPSSAPNGETQPETSAASTRAPGVEIVSAQGNLGGNPIQPNVVSRAVAQLQADTQQLIETTQSRQVATMFPGSLDAEASLVQQCDRQLKDLVSLSKTNKKLDKTWIQFADRFLKQCENLKEDPQLQTEIPEGFANLSGPGNEVTNKKIIGREKNAHVNIYDHAIKMLDNPADYPNCNAYDKRLASQMLGCFCVMQANRTCDPSAYAKANLQMELSTKLFAASLAVSTTPVLKSNLKSHAENFSFEQLARNLDSLSETLPQHELKQIFVNGVFLAVMTDQKGKPTDIKTLFQKGSTDRTYEKDVTVMNGKSRQTVFKESMLRAVEILKNELGVRSKNDDGKSRMRNAAKTKQDIIRADPYHLFGLEDLDTDQVSDSLLEQLTLASIVQNDLSLEEGHISRGSLAKHINKYEQHSTREIFKNHSLHGFETLSDILTNTAIEIRQGVNARINEMKARATDKPVSAQEIDRLIKQIIITTDAKASVHQQFNLNRLISTAEELINSNTEGNRAAFNRELGNIQDAWGPENLRDEPDSSKWETKDQRSAISRALKSNPVKSLPFINQTPVLGRAAAATSNLAKAVLVASGGMAGGSVAIAGLIGAAVVAAPIYGAYVALRKTV